MTKVNSVALRDRIIFISFAKTLRETADRLNKTPQPLIFDEVHYTKGLVIDHDNDEPQTQRM
ncbi:hypothetical protein [Mesorhizobium sp. SP-1A]|uniref:hypothetical protein n=1 Tax=Mesorhizobium sp. SP-1A TaxID=3077840 RepID=UPI0028F73565|nr:hypothetical protein [Mesorhizobium sp. SP-1A]